jgi:hypothetical protein
MGWRSVRGSAESCVCPLIPPVDESFSFSGSVRTSFHTCSAMPAQAVRMGPSFGRHKRRRLAHMEPCEGQARIPIAQHDKGTEPLKR